MLAYKNAPFLFNLPYSITYFFCYIEVNWAVLSPRFRASSCFLRESKAQRSGSNTMFVTKALSQDVMAMVISLRSSIADPQGVAQPPLQSAFSHGTALNTPNF